MKKSYKIDVDCANCANKMEEAAQKTAGVKNASVNFMILKMNVEFEDGYSYYNCSGLSRPVEFYSGYRNGRISAVFDSVSGGRI